jgi:hypothetical protein
MLMQKLCNLEDVVVVAKGGGCRKVGGRRDAVINIEFETLQSVRT